MTLYCCELIGCPSQRRERRGNHLQEVLVHLAGLQIAVISVQWGHESREPSPNANLLIVCVKFKSVRTLELQVRQPNLQRAAGAHREAPGHAVHLQVTDHLTPFLALVLERLLDTLGELLMMSA